jgi:2-aminoadipate transaminase
VPLGVVGAGAGGGLPRRCPGARGGAARGSGAACLRGQAPADEVPRLRDVETISLARGVPAPECLPVDDLADCARTVLERDGRRVLNYGPSAGYAPLRERLAARHGVASDRVLVTNGSLQAFTLLVRLLLAGRHPRVLVEGPTYDRPLKILADAGADVTAIPFGDDGLDLDMLEQQLEAGPPPAFLYTIPTFQNPSGRSQPLGVRRRLVELARDRGLLLVEDDPYALVRFEGEPLPSLFDLAGGEGVVYTSSFSKVVSPGLRVGYVVSPPSIAPALEECATRAYLAPVFLGQAIVSEYLDRGLFEPNLERVCALLRERRNAMLAALTAASPPGVTWSRPEGGYFVWLELPRGVDAAALLERSEGAGVTFVRGADFYPSGGGGESSARLAYSFVSPEQIAEGVNRLGTALARDKVSA